jgi:N-acetylglucosamine kinase-like BadF-type ATPase
MKVVAGLDAGGTKLAIRAETLAGDQVTDVEVAATGWEAAPAGPAADWLLAQLAAALPDDAKVVAAGIGAQGCDSAETTADLEGALLARGLRATVVNDGALLVPAAGVDEGIGVVAGTGSIAVGTDASGRLLLAGGWGWVLGDEGGSAALVREATKAVLAAHDAGRLTAGQDGVPGDALLGELARTFGVSSTEQLARAVNDEPTVANWAPHAAAVFAAADAGSALAVQVIDDAAAHLAVLVGQLIARGAVASAVVAGGSVIARQPRLADALQARLLAADPRLDFRVLNGPPVAGAVVLARRLAASSQ